MCTSFAQDLKRWTCAEELAARDAMIEAWALALHATTPQALAPHPDGASDVTDATDAIPAGGVPARPLPITPPSTTPDRAGTPPVLAQPGDPA
ncbi:hypothetical protein [Azohydromonas sediminis]|uniref:hypothetical protein n=1 Tax=Azohydromonas sediminis TaxID=2259674 RepID=UPI000E659A93|nr:hypothetical protein [Azohydromonas sediminis]